MTVGGDGQLQDLPGDEEEREEDEGLDESPPGNPIREAPEPRRGRETDEQDQDQDVPRDRYEVKSVTGARVRDRFRVLIRPERVCRGNDRLCRRGLRGSAVGRGLCEDGRRDRKSRERREEKRRAESAPYIAGVGAGATEVCPQRRTRSVRFVWYSYVASLTRSVIR